MTMGLVAIGREMKQRLAGVKKGYVTRVLFGGLILVLERREQRWRLAVGRPNTPPSKTEAETVGRDLGVPDGVKWSWTTKRNPQKKVTYQVAECEWQEGAGDEQTQKIVD